MPRETDLSINERQFVISALERGIRLDGRSIKAFRPLQVTLGHADSKEDENGVASVELGATRVQTRLSYALARPSAERKFDGTFTITTELSGLASAAYVDSANPSGSASDLEMAISSALDTIFRRSGALPTESLCLQAGQTVWAVRATLHVFSNAGSLLTASSISLLAALLNFRLPASEVRGGELKVFGLQERDPVPLALLHRPICIEMAIYQDHAAHLQQIPSSNNMDLDGEGMIQESDGIAPECVIVLDPTQAEQQCAAAEVIVGANSDGSILMVEKRGGLEVDAVQLLAGIRFATGKVREIVTGAIAAAVETEAVRRKARDRTRQGFGLEDTTTELRADHDR